MARAAAVVLFALALAGCGGSDRDDAPTEAEVRRAAARACTEYNQELLDPEMPSTRAAARRLERDGWEMERDLLARLARIDARGAQARLLERAIEARERSLEARRRGAVDAAADEEAARAFEGL